MMLKFIELHDKDTDIKLSFNVDKITVFSDQTIDTEREGFEVAESYEEIKQLIHDVGVLIHKPDPRLNLTKPLTMDALRDMEGQPVWNSNTLKWMLIHRFVDADKPIVWLVLSDGQFKVMTVDDLIKTPLYRMVQR